MQTKEKLTLKYIGKIVEFNNVIRKLTTNIQLSETEKSYLLSVAILLIKNYQIDSRYSSYLEFAYYILLKYSLNTKDFKPLFDISVNLGFYPIANDILKYELLDNESIEDSIILSSITRFKNKDSFVETLEQNYRSKEFLSDKSFEKCYLAPTSFGKSSLIVSTISELNQTPLRIVIVVPTKSLLMQTYQLIRKAKLGRKIIMHDEMYNEEKDFIAVFTQERALRLMSRKNIAYDVLFIDEAHNILNNNGRSILLSRLIAKNKILNNRQKVIYLSPLIENIDNIKISDDQIISSHIIKFNIKEPDLYEFCLNGSTRLYNRFLDNFYSIDSGKNPFLYTIESSKEKNFIYNYRPIKTEEFSRELCTYLPEIEMTKEIIELKKTLRREVHDDFYAIEYLKYGVVYLHGKLPDLIKEYIEEKYRLIPSLKYIIANSVILEGMNLPIDNLFIFNTRGLHGKELINLIGRVNRLNQIFNLTENLHKLNPSVHFVNTEKYNSKNSQMENKVKELRSSFFTDSIDNPILTAYDIEDKTRTKDQDFIRNIRNIQENEQFISSIHENDQDNIKAYLIESCIFDHYKDIAELTGTFFKRIRNIKLNNIQEDGIYWNQFTMLEKLNYLFVKDITSINDFEIQRIENEEARNYYENFILIGRKKSLKENIISQFEYFKKKAKSSQSKMYFGPSYGEVDYNNNGNKKIYIDLTKKTDRELINLAVVKLKMEEDFVSFKLNKLIVMLFDFSLIDQDDYNLYIYGTKDEEKIAMTKYGLNISLITRLANDGQLKNLSFDIYNNLIANEEFINYLNSVDDFYRFEVGRFLN